MYLDGHQKISALDQFPAAAQIHIAFFLIQLSLRASAQVKNRKIMSFLELKWRVETWLNLQDKNSAIVKKKKIKTLAVYFALL